jgi:putative transcriptional regulator
MKGKENVTLKNLRVKNGFTYQEMADKLKICKAYYWQIEHNNRRIQYQLAKEIAAIFHLKPDDIFYDETN